MHELGVDALLNALRKAARHFFHFRVKGALSFCDVFDCNKIFEGTPIEYQCINALFSLCVHAAFKVEWLIYILVVIEL